MTHDEILKSERMHRFDRMRAAARERGVVRQEVNGRRVVIERDPQGVYKALVDNCTMSATSKALYSEIWD